MDGLEAARADRARSAPSASAISRSRRCVRSRRSGTIDVHQLGYNLLWRYAERDAHPATAWTHGIAVIAYSALAHGILTGKFGARPNLAPGDQRHTILPFRADIWPHVHAGVEKLKALAADLGLPLRTLAIRWILDRPGIDGVVVGARNRDQSAANVAALAPAIPPAAFAAMTAISDDIAAHVPDVGNLFNHYP